MKPLLLAAGAFACLSVPAFAQECVPLEIALNNIATSGGEVIETFVAPNTKDSSILVITFGGLVFAAVLIDGCVIADSILVGAYVKEEGV
jgi:hypothetical protein